MHVLVLGAGVAGVTTAYYLSRSGCRVTLVDQAPGVGTGASYANGGQLSYSFTDALAKPGFIAALPRLLLGRDRGLQVNMDADLVAWGLRFLRQCTPLRARENTIAVLQLAMRSAELMESLRGELPFDFSFRPAGKLVMLRTPAERLAAQATSDLKRAHGCATDILSLEEAIDIEPAIADMQGDWTAAVYSRTDEVADSYAFLLGLKSWLETNGNVRFRFDAAVEDIVIDRGKARGVIVAGECLDADAIVVCLGAWSPALLRRAGLSLPIYPVRGYSVTLPPGPSAPSVSITALADRLLFCRINGFLRVSGFADFTGFSTAADSRRSQMLVTAAKSIAPNAADFSVDDAQAWGGLRPMTPDGQPRTGPTPVAGLFTNTGHGMLGWTLACASAFDAAEAVARSQ